MLHIKNLDEGLEIFKTLGSDVRMKIVELLSEHGEMNMNEIASALALTNGALTAHIRKLEECGIIQTVTEYTGHGNQKRCSMKIDQILLSGRTEETREIKVYDTEVRIGHFSDYDVAAPCGLCSVYSLIGEENDPRYFSHADRLSAGLVWLGRGYIEYRIPIILPEDQQMSQVTFYFEISSDRVGDEESCQADIAFYMNGEKLGTWLTPGDFRWGKGIYTPPWWNGQEKQFGLQKMIVINDNGVYLDGLRSLEKPLKDFAPDGMGELRFRFAVENQPEHKGGLVLYGSGFGNYNQDLRVRVHYSDKGN